MKCQRCGPASACACPGRHARGGLNALSALLALAGVSMAPRAALGNGRFPEANQLVVDSSDARHLMVRTTFGLLRTFDGGATWSWICEGSISPLGLLDEEILITTAGRTSVALSDGMAIDDGYGCDWNRVSGDIVGQKVIDLVGDAHDPALAYAAVGVNVNASPNGRIAKTTDGASWRFVGDLLPGIVPLTIDVAAGLPGRVYLGSNDANFEFGFIDVSNDGGLTWDRHAAPNGPDSAYVSAIDPGDADRIYARATFPTNTLFVSEDRAATWTAVHTADSRLAGFALSPDGGLLAVGGQDGLTILSRADVGDGTSTFAIVRGAPLSTRCLTWTKSGLFACSDEIADGFTIGLSIDDGSTFRPLLRLADLIAARCPDGTSVARTCPARWCEIAASIGAACTAPIAPPPSPSVSPSSGCGCRVGGASSRGALWWLAGMTVLLPRTKRRRDRRANELHSAPGQTRPSAAGNTS